MHHYALRSRIGAPLAAPSNDGECAADPAAVLALVAAAVPLTTDSLRALRLTCKATRLAVDEGIKELVMSGHATEGLRAVGSSLTSGLTSVRLTFRHQPFSALGILNAATISVRNSNHMKTLDFLFSIRDDAVGRAALAMLGAVRWRRLTSLIIACHPGVFTLFINIDYMPGLTELRLHRYLSAADVNALRRGAHFPATIEILELPGMIAGESGAFLSALGDLLKVTPRLRHLQLGVDLCTDLSFLAAELPSLEYLCVQMIGKNASLSHVTSRPRPRLHTIDLECLGSVGADHLTALPSHLTVQCPVLRSLSLCFDFTTWEFMLEMSHSNLEELTLIGGQIDDVDVVDIAAGLARLPALERLNFSPRGDDDEILSIDVGEAYEILLSGPPLPRLSRLETGLAWSERDESLDALIVHADKIPHLEELVMREARIGPAGFEALAAAGRAGRWPRLKLVQVRKIEGDDTEHCRHLLQEVWPGLQLRIGGGM